MNKSKSLYFLESLNNLKLKKNYSFNDYNKLLLKGKIYFLSYGNYLNNNKKRLKIDRQKRIKNFYYNLK